MSGSGLNKTTGTKAFSPSLGEMVLYCYSRCGIRRTAVTREHMQDATTAANMVLSDWANEQPNLWTVDEQTVALTEGQAQYSVPADTILILDAVIEVATGTETPIDLYMYPISRTEWMAFPDKTTPGRPTVYWFDRLLSPTVTLWQPPSDPSWMFKYYRVSQIQDAALGNAATLEIPYYFLRAFGDALSAELAIMYAPEKAVALRAAADISWKRARDTNAEDVPLWVTPGLDGLYRGLR